jgi:hypothetical protein
LWIDCKSEIVTFRRKITLSQHWLWIDCKSEIVTLVESEDDTSPKLWIDCKSEIVTFAGEKTLDFIRTPVMLRPIAERLFSSDRVADKAPLLFPLNNTFIAMDFSSAIVIVAVLFIGVVFVFFAALLFSLLRDVYNVLTGKDTIEKHFNGEAFVSILAMLCLFPFFDTE